MRDPRIIRRRPPFWRRIWNRLGRVFEKPRPRAALAIGLAVLLYLCVNLAAYPLLKGWRLDLTERGLHTLSAPTLDVLRTIPEPVSLRLYVSQAMADAAPHLAGFAIRLRELLEEYAVAAAGGIALDVYDPEPFSDAEDEAVAFGLAPLPLPDGRVGYLGLVGTNGVDDVNVIPFFRPERETELEYDLTKLVRSLATPVKPRIAVLGRLPIVGDETGDRVTPPWLILGRLREFFDVDVLPLTVEQIDPGVAALLLLHPRGLSPATAYAVDQFLMDGGRAVVMVDPSSEAETLRRPTRAFFAPNDSDLGVFGASWGVELAPDRVAADRRLAIAVEAADGDSIDYVAWLRLEPQNFSADDRITAGLTRLLMGSPGILHPRQDATTRFTPLVWTTEQAMPIAAGLVRATPDPGRLLADYSPGGERLVLAGRIQGSAASAFASGPPDGSPRPGHLDAATTPLDVVVIADTDIADDRFWVEVRTFPEGPVAARFADNDLLLVRAIESLTGVIDLTPLRGRAAVNRPFDRILALEAEAARTFRDAERTLSEQLRESEAALRAMTVVDDTGMLLSYDERQALDDLRARVLQVRRELRAVQRALRHDIDRLGLWLQFINMALMPIVLVALSLVVVAMRGRRPRRARRRP